MREILHSGCASLCMLVPMNLLKQACFEDIKEMDDSISMSWMVISDFNEILMASKKRKGVPMDIRICNGFNNWF